MAENLVFRLGDDTDCENCGRSINEVSLELIDDDHDIWELSISIGCYGGQAVTSDNEMWEPECHLIIETALRFPDFGDDEAQLLWNQISKIKPTKRGEE